MKKPYLISPSWSMYSAVSSVEFSFVFNCLYLRAAVT